MLKPITTKAAAWSQTLFPTASGQRITWLLLKLKKKSTYPYNWSTACCLFCSLVILVKIFLSFNLNLFNISRFPLFGKKYQLKFANDVSAETHCLVHFPSFIRFSSYFITQVDDCELVCWLVPMCSVDSVLWYYLINLILKGKGWLPIFYYIFV